MEKITVTCPVCLSDVIVNDEVAECGFCSHTFNLDEAFTGHLCVYCFEAAISDKAWSRDEKICHKCAITLAREVDYYDHINRCDW
jgi:hypothetical protein